jgi:hypothetical protein
MPDVKLDVADAAELAEMLKFLSEWLSRDPGRLGDSLERFVGHPAYGLNELRGDLERFLPARWQRRRGPLRPMTRISRPAEPTQRLAGLNVVRPRWRAAGAAHLTPDIGPALTGQLPGGPAGKSAVMAPAWQARATANVSSKGLGGKA